MIYGIKNVYAYICNNTLLTGRKYKMAWKKKMEKTETGEKMIKCNAPSLQTVGHHITYHIHKVFYIQSPLRRHTTTTPTPLVSCNNSNLYWNPSRNTNRIYMMIEWLVHTIRLFFFFFSACIVTFFSLYFPFLPCFLSEHEKKISHPERTSCVTFWYTDP